MILFLDLFSTLAQAEYRAFELAIVNNESGNEKRIITTLDHLQYPDYYPLSKGESLVYVDSWMCWDNTSGFQDICPNTKRRPAEQKPNSPTP